VYYQLYTKDGEMASKVAISPEEPSLGRIRADSVAPPHTPSSLRRCISRVEGNSALASAKLFSDRSCKTPMKETNISIITGRCPGLTCNQPMALVTDKIQDVVSPIPYTIRIKSRHDHSELNFIIGEYGANASCDSLGVAMAKCEGRRDSFH
jgi:hypothetical protein